ncbi:hypothetical protein [Synechococcus sp. MIT S9507]|uniref:hypothetical protein n=1 Tax=Synechococcus sp. MIT S9507 TaxID=3082544 RepID=UPI0039B4062E
MPKITTTCVEMTCLQGLADLERLEGPWVELIAGNDPEGAAVMLRLLLAHMASTSKRLLGAMVLDRLDVEADALECALLRQGNTRLQIGSCLKQDHFQPFSWMPRVLSQYNTSAIAGKMQSPNVSFISLARGSSFRCSAPLNMPVTQ